jgi:formylglycine-generating enzyme required for sulfatase activity
MPTVLVGDPGNPTDVAYSSAGAFGSVAYAYRMGAYEVTNDQYTAFLNAVAAEDSLGLYDLGMDEIDRGGIVRSGVFGAYSYAVKENMGNKPVNWINFWDAARFVNWLHNGQPTGGQTDETTEDGAYDLNGMIVNDSPTWTRKPGARWFLPTENEWYKAAFYDPRSTAQGGPPGNDHYWLYQTRSDAAPAVAGADGQGNISNAGANVVNYALGADWNGLNGNFTTVGSAGPQSASFYGTHDQAGNITEMTESPLPPTHYVVRGGNYASNTNQSVVGATYRTGTLASLDSPTLGFRVAAAVEIELPTADFNQDLRVDGIDFLTWQRGAGGGGTLAQGDADGDGAVDGDDLIVWQNQFGGTGATAALGAVPEPASLRLGFLPAGIAVYAYGRWRPRHTRSQC